MKAKPPVKLANRPVFDRLVWQAKVTFIHN